MESNIRAPVLLNLLNSLRKRDASHFISFPKFVYLNQQNMSTHVRSSIYRLLFNVINSLQAR